MEDAATRARTNLLAFVVNSNKLQELRRTDEKAYNTAIEEAASLVLEYGKNHESWVPTATRKWLDSVNAYLRKYGAS